LVAAAAVAILVAVLQAVVVWSSLTQDKSPLRQQVHQV
jgi:hypothetical protein